MFCPRGSALLTAIPSYFFLGRLTVRTLCSKAFSSSMADLVIKSVLISDKIDIVCKEVFEDNGIKADCRPGISKEDLISCIKDYDCLVVRSATKVTQDVFAAAPNLKLVGRAGTGVDNIDLKAATQHGVLVMNTPGGNTMSAAEHTCAMIFSLARNIPQGYMSMQAGKWERSKFMGCELKGKTLAIIGLGRIGKEVALRMQACEMRTVGYDPIVPKEAAAEFGVEFLELEQIWPVADFITVHTPLIPQTKGLINAKTFEKCRNTVCVINVARGGIIDEGDLLQALNSGMCGGAALDVFVNEPPSGITAELIKHPRVICTPHLGASTVEAQVRVAKEIAEQIVDACHGEAAVGIVNAPAIALAVKEEVKPWMTLGEALGRISVQMGSVPKRLHLQTKGEQLKSLSSALRSAVAFGVLKSSDKNVNLLNAPVLAKEKGMEITCSNDDMVDCCYSNCLSLTSESNSEVCGTVVDNRPMLVKYMGVRLGNPLVLKKYLVIGYAANAEREAMCKKLLQRAGSFDALVSGVNADSCVVIASFTSMSDESLGKEFHSVIL